jgi:hypothetical protein
VVTRQHEVCKGIGLNESFVYRMERALLGCYPPQVRDFKGKTYVDIREYYTDKNMDMMPGKKGISLNVEQVKLKTSNLILKLNCWNSFH